MKKYETGLASCYTLFMFLDIGAGIIFSIFIGTVFHINISPLWILSGVAFALLPDIDMIPYFIKTKVLKKPADDHRSFTHYPIIYVPLIIAAYYVFGIQYGLLFALCVYFHLLHDTLWLGWGISWFWPITPRKFKFFPDKHGEISSQLLMTWTKDEEKDIFKKYHNPHWVRDFYFRPNMVSYVEYSVFIFALFLLIKFL